MKVWCILNVNGSERHNLEQIQCRTMYVSEVKSFVGVMYFIHSYGICNRADVWSFSTLFYCALWLTVTDFESMFNHKLYTVYCSFPPCRMIPFLGWNFFSSSSAHLREVCGNVSFVNHIAAEFSIELWFPCGFTAIIFVCLYVSCASLSPTFNPRDIFGGNTFNNFCVLWYRHSTT